MITWGCPKSCSYCINAFYHTFYKGQSRIRHYSPERIIAELELLKNTYGITYFHFHDEDFLLKSDAYLDRLASLYSGRVRVPFSIMASPGSVTEGKVEILQEMKCSTVAFGIETGDQSIRSDILCRMDSPEDIHRAVALFNHAGIRTSSFNMLALPFYSREAYEKTIRLNRESGIVAAYASFFYPYEGTPARDIAVRHGFFDPEDPKTTINRINVPALCFPDISCKELIAMREVFPLYCHLTKEYFPYIRRSEINDRTGILLREELFMILGRTGIPKKDRCEGGYPAGFQKLEAILNMAEE
jgi:biotin synthase-like enzyme